MKKIYPVSFLGVTALVLALLIGPFATSAAGPTTINLRSAGNYVILAKAGISTTGTTNINGDIGVSPVSASAITGFGLTIDSSLTFSTSSHVVGHVFAADYAAPTPTVMTAAISDMETVYTEAAGRTNPTATELGAGNIGGKTLAPGLYKWSTDVTIPTNVTLAGGANDIWVFQVAQKLDLSSGKHILLSGGAQASNVFWQVAGQTTLGTNSAMVGNILDQTAIVLNTGASLNGRALAQTAVTMDANIVTIPAVVAVTPTNTNTTTNTNTAPTTNTNTAVNTNTATTSDPTLPNTGVNTNGQGKIPWEISVGLVLAALGLGFVFRKRLLSRS